MTNNCGTAEQSALRPHSLPTFWEHRNLEEHTGNIQGLSVPSIQLFIPSFDGYLSNADNVHQALEALLGTDQTWYLGCPALYILVNISYAGVPPPKSLHIPQGLELLYACSPSYTLHTEPVAIC